MATCTATRTATPNINLDPRKTRNTNLNTKLILGDFPFIARHNRCNLSDTFSLLDLLRLVYATVHPEQSVQEAEREHWLAANARRYYLQTSHADVHTQLARLGSNTLFVQLLYP